MASCGTEFAYFEIEHLAWRPHSCHCSHATFWQKNAQKPIITFPWMSFKHLRLYFVAHLSQFKIYYFCISWTKWNRIDGTANTQVVQVNVSVAIASFSLRDRNHILWLNKGHRTHCILGTYVTSHCHKMINYSMNPLPATFLSRKWCFE